MTYSYPIALRAMEILLYQLHFFGNIPGKESIDAFEIILRYFEDTLRGFVEPNYYLAALDPGVGKSQLVAAFIQAWKEAGFKPHGGMVIFLSRVEEIKSYAKCCGLTPLEYATVTSKKAALDHCLHVGDRATAFVTFATQQKLQVETEHQSFGNAAVYHFNGQPRALRIWDETINAAEAVTLRVDTIAALPDSLRAKYPAYSDQLEALSDLAKASGLGDVVDVPGAFGSPPIALIGPDAHLSALLRPDQAKLICDLKACAGLSLALVRDNRAGLCLVGACKPLPADFAPIFVLDASARLRHTYNAWQIGRGNLVRLPAAPIDYANLKVHLWEATSGRSSLEDATVRKPIVGAVQDLIGSKPTEEWLIVYHKLPGDDLRREIEAKLPSGAKVSFVYWGNHHGTNAYQHIQNVVVIGLLRYSEPSYAALHVAASNALPVGKRECAQTAYGEIASNLLQAGSRSSVRTGAEGVCGHAEMWVIATASSGLGKLIDAAFPGCNQVKWEPHPTALRHRDKLLMEELIRQKIAGLHRIRKNSTWSAAGIKNASRLWDIVQKPAFQSALAAQGMSERGHYFYLND